MKGGGQRTQSVRVLAILVFLGSLGGAAALEPDGPVAFRPLWSETDPAVRDAELRGPGAVLGLEVVSSVGLRDSSLEVRLPPGLAGVLQGEPAARLGRKEVEPDGTTLVRVELGDLAGGALRELRFRLSLDDVAGAVATFTVRGTDEHGAPVRDSFGVVIGVPGARPENRHGAIEFRAVPIPGPVASER